MTIETPDRPTIAGMTERQLLDALLASSARQSATKAVVDDIRTELTHRAQEHQARTGLAWSGKARGVGNAYMTDPEDRVVVGDHGALGAWAGEHFPQHATAVITVPATALAAVLEALDGVVDPADRPVTLTADPKWTTTLLEEVAVMPGEDGAAAQIVHSSGVPIEGLKVTRTPQQLKVVIDKEARARAASELVQPVRLAELTGDLHELPEWAPAEAALPAAGGR